MRRGLKAWVGAEAEIAVATERPCLLSPNNTPSPPGPEGCWAGLGPCPAPCWCCLWFAVDRCASGQIVSLKCSGESLQGLGRRRWEKEVSHAPWGGRARWGGSPGSGGCLAHSTHWALPADTALLKQKGRPHGRLLPCPHQLLIWAGDLLPYPLA